ncbi:hypothetical protein AB6U14_00030 [Klebsiella pneumoniae]
MHSAEIHTIQPGEVLFPAFFSSENGERGRNLLRGREALLKRSRKTGFQHLQESGSSTAKQSRYGKSPDDSPHDSPHDSNRELNQESP